LRNAYDPKLDNIPEVFDRGAAYGPSRDVVSPSRTSDSASRHRCSDAVDHGQAVYGFGTVVADRGRSSVSPLQNL
jgi:hypothetical protein